MATISIKDGNNALQVAALVPNTGTAVAAADSLPVVVRASTTLPSSVPQATTVTILALTTAATGTNWTAFASTVCTALDIVNNTGTTVEYRRGGTGNTMQIPTGSSRLVAGITNANTIEVRRVDTANAQVTVQAEAFAL